MQHEREEGDPTASGSGRPAGGPGRPAGGAPADRAAPWYVEAFRADYRRVYPHRDLPSARVEARRLVERGLKGRVLDLGSGFGRHTLALRELGVDAFGLDLSADLLAGARALPGADALRGRLVRADARRLPFAAASFDGVALLFSSYGYFDDRANADVLGEVARVLRPGGVVVLDLMNPARVRAGLVPRSTRAGDGFTLTEERGLTGGGRRVVKTVRLTDARGERSWREDVRLYEPEEIDALCAAAGLAVEARDGDFDGRPFHSGHSGHTGHAAAQDGGAAASPRQIVWARRESPPGR